MAETVRALGEWMANGPIAISFLAIVALCYVVVKRDKVFGQFVKENTDATIKHTAVLDKAFDKLSEIGQKVDNQSKIVDDVGYALKLHEKILDNHEHRIINVENKVSD